MSMRVICSGRSRFKLALVLAVLFCAKLAPADSFYTERPDDPHAVYVELGGSVHGDGQTDDSDGLQALINKVQETSGQGVVFLPSGRYRLTKTVYIWPGIRVLGYGQTRPVFVLSANTPGFQSEPNYMVFFAGNRPGSGYGHGFPFRQPTQEELEEVARQRARFAGRARGGNASDKPSDANPGTFYSALSNVDFEIGDGNPQAVAVRGRYAQHCYLSHIDFHTGSGWAGIHDGGNFAEDLRFFGGEFGIVTRKPSPGWQYTLIDTHFEGQRSAAIREHEAGLTLVRPEFQDVPTAVSIDAGYSDEFWMKDAVLKQVSGPAFIVSNEKNFRTEVNFEHVQCENVPMFAMFRESKRELKGPGARYEVSVFSHGLKFSGVGAEGSVETSFQTRGIASLAPPESDVPALPPMNTWVNLSKFGAKGDGRSDDTEALRKAISSARTIYIPIGAYRVNDTITLRPDTVLIGFHPSATRIFIDDNTAAFAGVGDPKPVLEVPREGTNIVSGIGIYTSGKNPRAVGVKWMAGTHSLMNDVRFLGGHGTSKLNGFSEDIYNNTHTADPNPERQWDSQYPSLWITNGGGGTFMDIWTPSTFAQAGMLISDSTTPGRIYQMSSEHHVRNEIQLRNAANWEIYALQTEEELGESAFALPLSVAESHNITFANFHLYRVVGSYQPFPTAVNIENSRDISFRNFHCYSDSKVSFDNAIRDVTSGAELRQREFASLTVNAEGAPKSKGSLPTNGIVKLASGFFSISGTAADRAGNVYFVDAHWQRIYRWSVSARTLTLVRDNPLQPYQLAFDRSGKLIVVAYRGDGTVYTFDPNQPGDSITLLKPEPAKSRPNATPLLPSGVWRNENDFPTALTTAKPYHFVSPDQSVFLPVSEDFLKGALYYGVKMQEVLRTFGLAPASPGKPFYICDENQERTYKATVGTDGNFTKLDLFAERGGESVVSDDDGNVYIAAGQIYVYNKAGDLLREIRVPERPLSLVLGGADRKSLFVAARTSLYEIPLKTPSSNKRQR
jgi:hypothetical protein